MELEFAIFARYLEVNPDATFAMQGGGLNRLTPSSYPAQIPHLALLARFRPSPEEVQQEHSLRVDLSGPGMERIILGLPSKSTIVAPNPLTAVEGFRLNCAVSLLGFIFQAPGEFTFHILIDGNEVGGAKLQLAAPAATGGGA